jgi:hypothetical protein
VRPQLSAMAKMRLCFSSIGVLKKIAALRSE